MKAILNHNGEMWILNLEELLTVGGDAVLPEKDWFRASIEVVIPGVNPKPALALAAPQQPLKKIKPSIHRLGVDKIERYRVTVLNENHIRALREFKEFLEKNPLTEEVSFAKKWLECFPKGRASGNFYLEVGCLGNNTLWRVNSKLSKSGGKYFHYIGPIS